MVVGVRTLAGVGAWVVVGADGRAQLRLGAWVKVVERIGMGVGGGAKVREQGGAKVGVEG